MASASISLRSVGTSSNDEGAKSLNGNSPFSFEHLGTLMREKLVNHLVTERFFGPHSDRTRAAFVDAEIIGSTFLLTYCDFSSNKNYTALPAGPAQGLAELVK